MTVVSNAKSSHQPTQILDNMLTENDLFLCQWLFSLGGARYKIELKIQSNRVIANVPNRPVAIMVLKYWKALSPRGIDLALELHLQGQSDPWCIPPKGQNRETLEVASINALLSEISVSEQVARSILAQTLTQDEQNTVTSCYIVHNILYVQIHLNSSDKSVFPMSVKRMSKLQSLMCLHNLKQCRVYCGHEQLMPILEIDAQ